MTPCLRAIKKKVNAKAPDSSLRRTYSEPLAVPPGERGLPASAIGAPGPSLAPMKLNESRIRVQVVHGDLAFARHTVAVGHYEGDSIVGPEALLDRHLNGRLALHSQLNEYPGPVGTAEVFLSPDRTSRLAGAVVMGLGKVGDLKPKGSAAHLSQGRSQVRARGSGMRGHTL